MTYGPIGTPGKLKITLALEGFLPKKQAVFHQNKLGTNKNWDMFRLLFLVCFALATFFPEA